mmetsp:Transcript_32280/g.60136  ORF Transcript_32280/g.60136 Transcript_32280/m.60136 type:complete len:1050 (+) Transcript_32280:61-3210(+)
MSSFSNDLSVKFQREINRISDSDRNTRKSGLKKLLENLPWNSTSTEEIELLRQTCKEIIFEPILLTLVDQVEKCRELSIALLTKIVTLFQNDLSSESLAKLTSVLCSRINDIPFPEKGEELRFQVVQLLHTLCPLIFRDDARADDMKNMFDMVLPAIGKALMDQFPDVKKACSEVLIEIGKLTNSEAIRAHYKCLLKGLIANASHQHYKVRSLSIKALSTVLACLASDITREKDLLKVMQDQLLPLLHKIVADRSTSPRKSTVLLLGTLIAKRIEVGSWFDPNSEAANSILATTAPGGTAGATSSSDVTLASNKLLASAPPIPPAGHDSVELDPEVSSHKAAALDTVLLSSLVVMLGDNDENVRASGCKHLKKISASYSRKHEGPEMLPFVRAFAPFILHNISGGILTSWTTEGKTRQIHALTALINAVRDLCEYTHFTKELEDTKASADESDKMEVDGHDNDDDEEARQRQRQRVTSELLTSRLLPQMLDALATTGRDETAEIRSATEACCAAIGLTVATAASVLSAEQVEGGDGGAYTEGVSAILAYLVPRVQGVLNGLDTAYHRTAAITLLTYIIQGIGSVESSPQSEKADHIIAELVIREVSIPVSDPCLFEFREVSLRESALLLTRSLYKLSPIFSKVVRENSSYQCALFQSFVYLCGRCAYEDGAVARGAKRELSQFAEALSVVSSVTSAEDNLVNQLSSHFESIVNTITNASNTNDSSVAKRSQPQPSIVAKPCTEWTADSAHRAAFEALVRECPRAAWKQHAVVISDVIIPLVQPPASLVKGSPEEIASTYAAQRGDLSFDGTTEDGSVNTRLGMLALLETLLRTGSSDWECSTHIQACCDTLIEKAFIPNLVWRAGRVEGVARKVTLTATYGLLKAGAIGPQALYKHAPHIVPLLASEMEDQDASARHLGCLCLTIIFERLKGGFGDQAVQDLYPRLLKRLDDSDDTIRVAICDTFKSFMLCAPKEVYRGTMITYTLDQLFIHLDDPDPKIQKCIFDVLLHIAEHVDAPLVLKKANANVQSHRSPVMCETVIRAVKKLTS